MRLDPTTDAAAQATNPAGRPAVVDQEAAGVQAGVAVPTLKDDINIFG